MNIENVANEIIKTDRFKNLLLEHLAGKISNEYHFTDIEGVMIKDEVRKMIVIEAKEMVKEVVEEYYEMSDVKTQIEDTIKSLTRKEILSLLRENI